MLGFELGLELVLVFIAIFISMLWVYADATKKKIGRIRGVGGLFNMPAALWAFLTLVIWVIALPLYILKRKSLIELAIENPVEVESRNLKVIILTFVLVGSALYLIIKIGLINTVEIVLVKESALEICPSYTVEEAVNSYVEEPKWDSGLVADGIHFVNITGNIIHKSKKAKALIQFKIDKRVLDIDNQAASYTYQALEINGVSQKTVVANELFHKMCDSIK